VNGSTERCRDCNASGPCAAVAVSAINAVDVVTPYKSHDCDSRHTVDDDEDDDVGGGDGRRRLSSILSDGENSAVMSECHFSQPSNIAQSSEVLMSPPPLPPSVKKLHHSCSFRVSLIVDVIPVWFYLIEINDDYNASVSVMRDTCPLVFSELI